MSSVIPATARPSPPSSGSVLAIDYGRRRLGLAVSDELGITARPLASWTRTNRRRDLARLRELCQLRQISRIVVGWPLHLNGTPGEMAAAARQFADRLARHLRLPVELVDERLSSWEADRLLGPHGKSEAARRRRKNLDDVAAAVILRDYLSRARGPAKS